MNADKNKVEAGVCWFAAVGVYAVCRLIWGCQAHGLQLEQFCAESHDQTYLPRV